MYRARFPAGQVLFALGDSNRPLKITEKGKDARMVFATDTRCSYANIVVRKELFDKGVKSAEALADIKLVGRKAMMAATAIGSGTYVNACYRAQQWIRTAKDEEVVDLLQKPYLSTDAREGLREAVRYCRTIFDWDFLIEEKDYERGMKVWVPLALEKPISFKQAVDMSFARKAQAKYK